MTRTPIWLLPGILLLSALFSPPAFETEREPSGRAPVPLRLGDSPAFWTHPEPAARSDRTANDNQTMGTGEVDVALEGGDGERAAGAPGQATPEDAGETPLEEDPSAGIAEEGDGEEPIDGYAMMTPEERAAWRQGVRQVEEDPVAPADGIQGMTPAERHARGLDPYPDEPDPVVESGGELGEGELDDVRTPEERAAGQQRWEPDGIPGHEPGDPETTDEEPDDPGDGAADQQGSILQYLGEEDRLAALGPTFGGVPPATPLPDYDPFGGADPELLRQAYGWEAPSTPPLTPGVYVHPPGSVGAMLHVNDPTLDTVILGQPFEVNIAIPTSQLDSDGDGRPDKETIDVAFASGDGEMTIKLEWDGHAVDELVYDGLFVFKTSKPVSLAGKSQGMDVDTFTDVDGTITGLDLDSYEGSRTVTISVDGQAFGAIDVYTNNTQRGLGMIGESLDGIGNVLIAAAVVIRDYRLDPEVMSDPKKVAVIDAWQARVDRRMVVLEKARALLADPDQFPIVKLRTGEFYLQRLIRRDESGVFGVADDIVPFSSTRAGDVAGDGYTDFVRMQEVVNDIDKTIREDLRNRLIQDVIPAYTLGIWDQAHRFLNPLGTFAWTALGNLGGEGMGTDHMGRPRTTTEAATHLAIDIGMYLIMVKLPTAVAEWGVGVRRGIEVGIPRFGGTPMRGSGFIPKRQGELARDTRFGTRPYPGTGPRGLSQAYIDAWHGKIAGQWPRPAWDAAIARADVWLKELDDAVIAAERAGLPRTEIDGVLQSVLWKETLADVPLPRGSGPNLTFIRGPGAVTLARFDLAIRVAHRDGMTIIVPRGERGVLLTYTGGTNLPNVREMDLPMIVGIRARAQFEARHGGKPFYSPDEVAFARDVLLPNKADLKKWLEFSESDGLRHLFDDAAIRDLETVFGSGGPPANRISANRGFSAERGQPQRQAGADEAATPFDSRGLTPDVPSGARAVGGGVRPLSTLAEYQALVARQAAGERLDLGQIARPGIVRVMDDGSVLVQQGAGRWENTRPDEFLDVFVDARVKVPEGAVVIERGVSPELVRQANLLSSRGLEGANPRFLDSPAIREVPEFTRIRIRARDVDAPTSDVRNQIESELVRLEGEGVDLTNLRQVMEPLSPKERLALLMDDAARSRAIEIGNARTEILDPADIERAIIEGRGEGPAAGGPPPPSGPPAPPPTGPAQTRVSDFDRQLIQKAFRHGRGENVDWSPEELTRLQQIAYPLPGQRPSVVQQKLMPVADQLGGQMKTLPQDRRTFGQELSLADERFLAYQEMEDMIALARQAGVSDQRIRLLTDGLGESAPVSSLDRASRALMRETDQARGIIVESGIPADYAFITRMYVVAKANNNKLTPGDVAWLRKQFEADQNFFTNLGRREFEDVAGQDYTIMTESGARDLKAMYDAATTGPATTPVSQATPLGTIDFASAAGAAMLGGASGRGGPNALIETYIVSTGGSTGSVMEAFFVNRGEPVRLTGEGIVLEPVAEVDPATMQRLQQIREAATQGKPLPPDARRGAGPMAVPWEGPSVTRLVLDVYCLQKDLGVPTPGMLFRIADAAQQAAQADLRSILAASESLRERGQLHPDDDPEGYFHSIRQWAVWADEKNMDAAEFEDAFTEHAKKNYTARGGQWTADVEQAVRERFAPGRWRDVEAVLEAAAIR